MRIVLGSLAIVTLLPNKSALAEGPVLAKWNRYFGLGWGDGYHASWNECADCYGQSCHAPGGQVPEAAVLPPAAGARAAHGARSATPSAPFAVAHQPPEAIAMPRLVRLPPVVEVSVMRRLPPVTDTPTRMTRLPPVTETGRITHRPERSPQLIEAR